MMHQENLKFLAALLPGESARRALNKDQPNDAPFLPVAAVRFLPNPVTPDRKGHVTFAGLPEQEYPIHTVFELATPYKRERTTYSR